MPVQTYPVSPAPLGDSKNPHCRQGHIAVKVVLSQWVLWQPSVSSRIPREGQGCPCSVGLCTVRISMNREESMGLSLAP